MGKGCRHRDGVSLSTSPEAALVEAPLQGPPQARKFWKHPGWAHCQRTTRLLSCSPLWRAGQGGWERRPWAGRETWGRARWRPREPGETTCSSSRPGGAPGTGLAEPLCTGARGGGRFLRDGRVLGEPSCQPDQRRQEPAPGGPSPRKTETGNGTDPARPGRRQRRNHPAGSGWPRAAPAPLRADTSLSCPGP